MKDRRINLQLMRMHTIVELRNQLIYSFYFNMLNIVLANLVYLINYLDVSMYLNKFIDFSYNLIRRSKKMANLSYYKRIKIIISTLKIRLLCHNSSNHIMTIPL
jgi:hypothetical protein